MDYGYKKKCTGSFDETVAATRSALANEGFGVLTEIDVAATLKKKLNVDRTPYLILGACNPPFAQKALEREEDVGLLLPCNVIVYEAKGSVFVAAVKPTVAMQAVENPALAAIAAEIEGKLVRVIDAVSA
ncbi:hypothetical protein COV04_01075 [Candidatus Uhrbacteria bacterium CG10_big_fil_rev_8_21_14_0_10_48_11]|uniref:DUF302 domain-containing protein n=1 Tax=Candidatus Uhrbacteria bacterium CG10_big_fil_rev_8_21_14_0_10_48_11 TaxID=1975037 RepID=A0A2M8LF94_9BACT|nr:MAG: hypothetical protein COV04_01075 [Candidatus Uhrbacteria bacterium CG10_big_fil_rev_8_21_14_0_10_48_11]